MNLITRLDFDGIVCAVMIYQMENVNDFSFSTPQTIEEGGLMDFLEVGDIIAHLPHHPDVGIWFHNHDVSHVNPANLQKIRGKFGVAPSTSRQVYDYYNSPELQSFEHLVKTADRIGTAQLTQEEVTNPSGWILISYTLDPRFISDHNFGVLIMDQMKFGKSPEEIIALEQVQKRVEIYKGDEANYIGALKEHTEMQGKVILTDFRGMERTPRGNRFSVFVHFPEGNVHMRLQSQSGFRVKVSVSKSIFNRTCSVHIGRMMEEYGGGGPEGAGTCIVGRKTGPEKIAEMINRLNV